MCIVMTVVGMGIMQKVVLARAKERGKARKVREDPREEMPKEKDGDPAKGKAQGYSKARVREKEESGARAKEE